MNKTLLQQHIDLLQECRRHNEMLDKIIELNMEVFWDVVDERDWYYHECQRLKKNISGL